MNIKFKLVKAHNFLSIGDIELTLDNRGYVLVEGKNNNPADNALSNGSGKSTIFNSICWALTGETIQGLKSNIPNIHGDDGCFVTLNFTVDKDEYEITRYRDYAKVGSDLKIKINGEDRSGKSLRTSEELLSQYLPDITPDLIGNIIILGQGLPHKFSNNTPAGRKELLEKLSKSDFMIQDIKNRIYSRSTNLENELRVQEDDKLKNETELNMFKKQLENTQTELDSLVGIDYTLEGKLKEEIERIESQIDEQIKYQDDLSREVESLELSLNEIKSNYDKSVNELNNKFDPQIRRATDELNTLKVDYNTLKNEIRTLDSITDVCPTCGQKLPDVHKVDTKEKKNQLSQLEKEVEKAQSVCKDLDKDHSLTLLDLKFDMEKDSESVNSKIKENKETIQGITTTINYSNNELNECKANYATYKAQLDNYELNKSKLEDTIKTLNNSINDINNKIMYNIECISTTNDHIETLNKINSLVKRDFRGVLLTNVIDFINSKVKDYCSKVFNTDDLKLYLDGNNLNIDFCGKSLENLSGGEQQRINIIIQAAIRSMMCQYLNFSSNMLVIDEVFDNLDSSGCTKILDLINYSFNDVESLFIISHHSDELNIPYDNIVTVEKDENGVSKLA